MKKALKVVGIITAVVVAAFTALAAVLIYFEDDILEIE